MAYQARVVFAYTFPFVKILLCGLGGYLYSPGRIMAQMMGHLEGKPKSVCRYHDYLCALSSPE